MKVIKRLSIFVLLVVLFGACFDSPDFSIVPKISINDVRVKITPDPAVADSLVVILNFEDGDGDLGLDPNNPDHSSNPFHLKNYFVESNGELIPIATRFFDSNIPILLEVPDGVTGNIATNQTRNKPGFGDLPPFEFPHTCKNYSYETIYFLGSDRDLFDETYTIELVKDNIYKTSGTFYYERNLNHHNFYIDILVKSAGSDDYVEFDWLARNSSSSNCSQDDLYSRFPVLTDEKRPLQGTLRYGYSSAGLQNLLTGKRIKIQVSIRDRALHKSNTVRSKEFVI